MALSYGRRKEECDDRKTGDGLGNLAGCNCARAERKGSQHGNYGDIGQKRVSSRGGRVTKQTS